MKICINFSVFETVFDKFNCHILEKSIALLAILFTIFRTRKEI